MSTVIKIVGAAIGSPCPERGMYVASYDPDGNDGMGTITFTENPDEALKYDNMVVAMDAYRAVSNTHPTRLDGLPNRPLTAYTVELLYVPK